MGCPQGHDDELEFVRGDNPTGVVAPDGVREIRYEEGYYCRSCKKVYDPEDIKAMELAEDFQCEAYEDLDCRCKKEATRIVHEPYTPAAFTLMLCEDHARSQIDFGYKPDLKADEDLKKLKEVGLR